MADVYLSPSSQWGNTYSYGNHNEAEICGLIADHAYNSFVQNGISCIRGDNVNKDMVARVSESKENNCKVHICIHTNAGGGKGTTAFSKSSTLNNKYVVAIYNEVAKLTPTTDRGIKPYDGLYEVANVNLCVYLEVEFHDSYTYAKWITENVKNIGEAIVKGYCVAEGKPYKGSLGVIDGTKLSWIGFFGNGYYSEIMEQYGQAQINNACIIYSYLIQRGFNHNAICAMLGNMMTEAYLNPQQWQHGYSPYDGNSRNGMGLVGWTPYWRITEWLESHGYDITNADSCGYVLTHRKLLG